MNFVIFSTPFCRPKKQAAKPMMTTMIIQEIWREGLDTTPPKKAPTWSGLRPASIPDAVAKK